VIVGINATLDKVWVGEVVREGYILICRGDVGAKGGIWVCASELGTWGGKTRIGGGTSIGGICSST
jgi:hypothetical protein